MSAGGIIVVGSGQAGAQTVFSLRLGGFHGRITLFGDEGLLPYQRPPLSKAYLKGEASEERLSFKPAGWYESHSVDLRLSNRVTAINRSKKTVLTEAGELVPYSHLVLATGSRPRPLTVPGADLDGVHELRTLADVSRLRPSMLPGARLLIVGGGYIGLEAAACARQLGLEVVIVEAAPRVLSRVTCGELSNFYENEHRSRGVHLLVGSKLNELTGSGGQVTGAKIDGVGTVPADIILAGIGVIPNQELARTAGLECNDGIEVDGMGRTSDPDIFAVGDCSSRPIEPYGYRGRLESVHNAIEQAKIAAASILGTPLPKVDCPWFWSDQYDLKLQTAGLNRGYDEIVVRGSFAQRSFSLFYFRDQVLIAVDAVNSPDAFLASKALIMSKMSVRTRSFSDTRVSMKDLAMHCQS